MIQKSNTRTSKQKFIYLGIFLLSLLPFFAGASTTNATSTEPVAIIWPEITAKSAFVYNPVSNLVLYEKSADTQRPIASLLKIMTAAVADDILDMSPSLASKKLRIPTYIKNENPADFVIQNGSVWTTENLTQAMLIGSSNKAAETLANGLVPRSSFISLMNFTAKRMGLTQTYFRNPTGLTEKLPGQKTVLTGTSTEGRLDIAGGVSTAREFSKLLWTVIAENPGLLDATHKESMILPNTDAKNNKTATVIKVENTNKILNNFPILFGKTGFTDNAGGNLAIVLQKDQRSEPYIIVVLGSTFEKRFDDVAALASTTLQFYTK